MVWRLITNVTIQCYSMGNRMASFTLLEYVGYGMRKWSANINHLEYTNDTIIFASNNEYSLKKIIAVIQDYEKQSGQK
ncbi:hypothetical protein HAX54_035645, partial [Datura stramonium]|nr:hypothetical protein [Datura stramonium]